MADVASHSSKLKDTVWFKDSFQTCLDWIVLIVLIWFRDNDNDSVKIETPLYSKPLPALPNVSCIISSHQIFSFPSVTGN